LMFYFYAMPFVLADPGIRYSATDSLDFESKKYPGFRISYGDSIGVSPKDEYFIYFNPENHQMEWLAYTVTYFSKEQSKSLGWIRYADWQEINGLILPKSLAWYKSEDNLPTTERNKRQFDKVMVSKDRFSDDQFAPTENARIIEE